MRKKIIGMFFCMLVIATCLPVTGTIDLDKNTSQGITPFYEKEHNINININKCWVYECQDEHNPGEYFFHIIVFPAFQYVKTEEYSVDDTHPQSSHNFGRLASIPVRFTPQFILIIAMEEDQKIDANPNDYLGRIMIKLAPPKDDYSPSNPYSLPLVRWNAKPSFEADVAISFYHQ
jgi:hypothetical protein